MSAFRRCLSAEILKSRRTIYLLGSVLLPTLLSVFNFLLHFGNTGQYDRADQVSAWMLFHHNTFTLGALIVFPVVFLFASTFTAHQEHDTHQWRRLLSMAVPRNALYSAKVAFTAGLGLLACLVMWAEDILFGWLYTLIEPASGLIFQQMPIVRMLLAFLYIFILGLFMTGLQFFMSMKAKNFVLSIGVGVACILAGIFLADVDGLSFIFPWALPASVYKADTIAELVGSMIYSLAGFALTVYWNGRIFVRQDILD